MINIVMDTNFLYQSYKKDCDYLKFELNKNYDELINYLKCSKSNYEFKLLIPKMVIEELKKQRVDSFLDDLYQINLLSKKLNNIINLQSLMDAEEFYRIINDSINAKLKDEQIEIIENCSNDNLKNIIDDAVNKILPFEGKDGKSDKGFCYMVFINRIYKFK